MTTKWWDHTNSTPKRRAMAEKNVRNLREMGFSYEEIPEHVFVLVGPPGQDLREAYANAIAPAPWEVYELANPSKSAGQVAAWKARHHPNG